MEKVKSNIGMFYKIGSAGVIACIVSLVLTFIALLSEKESLIGLSDWLLILGAFAWGASLVGAGNIFNKIGLKKTGVLKAGIALLLWGVTLFLWNLLGNEDDAPSLGWAFVSLVGPALFYFFLMNRKNINPEKFMNQAANGMLCYVVGNFLLIRVLHKVLSSGLWHVSQFTLVLIEHFTLIVSILVIVQIVGLWICLKGMQSYEAFVNQLEFTETAEPVQS